MLRGKWRSDGEKKGGRKEGRIRICTYHSLFGWEEEQEVSIISERMTNNTEQ